jgi:hypothetical protein
VADACRHIDHLSDEGYTIEDIVRRVLPADVLAYVAEQRAMRAEPASFADYAAYAAMWMDGFMAGATMMERRLDPKQPNGPSDLPAERTR